MAYNIIVAVTRDMAIGRGGDMIYHIGADLRNFKAVTMGHAVVMGRKTFESLPKGALPGRRNIVVSRRKDYCPAGAEVYDSLDEALAAGGDGAFVIGGGEIYRQAIDGAKTLYITEIDASGPADADTRFPDIDEACRVRTNVGEWQEDTRTGVRFRFVEYNRR